MQGTLFDGIIAVVFAFVLAIIIVISNLTVGSTVDALSNTTMPVNGTISANIDIAFGILDMGFIVAVIFSFLAGAILAYQFKNTPVFFVVSIILFTLMVFIAPTMSNMFYEFATTTGVVSYANNYPLIVFFFQNIAQIVVVAGTMILIATHAKPRGRS